jgi:hypothetical protein
MWKLVDFVENGELTEAAYNKGDFYTIKLILMMLGIRN